MRTTTTSRAWAAILLAVILTLAGCGGDDAGPGEAATTDGEAQHDQGDHDDDDGHHEDEADHEDDGHDEDGRELATEADLVIDMEMNDFAYLPAQLTIRAGEVVLFNVENTANNIHDFSIDKIDADLHIVALPGTGEHAHMQGPMPDLHFAFTEPGKGAIQVRIHEPGEYVYYCTVPGHRELGMET